VAWSGLGAQLTGGDLGGCRWREQRWSGTEALTFGVRNGTGEWGTTSLHELKTRASGHLQADGMVADTIGNDGTAWQGDNSGCISRARGSGRRAWQTSGPKTFSFFQTFYQRPIQMLGFKNRKHNLPSLKNHEKFKYDR
jgi:hypothetical protein